MWRAPQTTPCTTAAASCSRPACVSYDGKGFGAKYPFELSEAPGALPSGFLGVVLEGVAAKGEYFRVGIRGHFQIVAGSDLSPGCLLMIDTEGYFAKAETPGCEIIGQACESIRHGSRGLARLFGGASLPP